MARRQQQQVVGPSGQHLQQQGLLCLPSLVLSAGQPLRASPTAAVWPLRPPCPLLFSTCRTPWRAHHPCPIHRLDRRLCALWTSAATADWTSIVSAAAAAVAADMGAANARLSLPAAACWSAISAPRLPDSCGSPCSFALLSLQVLEPLPFCMQGRRLSSPLTPNAWAASQSLPSFRGWLTLILAPPVFNWQGRRLSSPSTPTARATSTAR